jgi:glycerate kinase
MILIAPDKFKGSLSARQVCQAITEGLLDINSALNIVSVPLADGGEGTCELLTEFSGGSMIKINALDPLFREIETEYGVSGDGSTAFIEMAKASGLQLLKPEERNPLITSTFGTGQLIVHALDRKVNKIVLGVGGSATNDAGMGMAEALGFQFLSSKKEKLKPVGQNLIQVNAVTEVHIHPRLRDCEFTVLYDVQSPLYGKLGAASVFAGQKGASAADIAVLDRGLAHFAEVVLKQFNLDINFPGAGAGGGIVAASKLIFNAGFTPGIDFVIRFTNLENQIQRASLIITGEGKIDDQTMSGKVVKGVAQLSAKHQKNCIAFTGKCDLPESKIKELALQEIITLVDARTSEEQAIQQAYALLKERAVQYLPHWIK